jgi:hypothetical protein
VYSFHVSEVVFHGKYRHCYDQGFVGSFHKNIGFLNFQLLLLQEKIAYAKTDQKRSGKNQPNINSPCLNQFSEEHCEKNARHQKHFPDVNFPISCRSDSDKHQIYENEKHPQWSGGQNTRKFRHELSLLLAYPNFNGRTPYF